MQLSYHGHVARTVADRSLPRPDAGTGEGSGHRTDGRAARGERTRRALAEALVALIEEGDLRPTARAVAERAGVSQRLVFHHFEDMEAVLRHAVAIQVERHWSVMRPVDPTLPTSEKVTQLVRQRATLFEAVSPVRRAASVVAHSSPTVAAELGRARRGLRQALAWGFAPELQAAGAKQAEMLEMLELASSWETWDQLRRGMGHGPVTARRLMTRMVEAAVARPPSTTRGDRR